MSQNRRVLTYVVFALIVGAGLALAVALSTSRTAESRATQATPDEVSAAALYSTGSDTALAVSDPAKEQPLLDKFTSKDPFVPLASANSTASNGSNSSSTGSNSNNSQPTDLAAKVKVDGTSYNVTQGDKLPGGSAAKFSVTGITSGDVTFGVIDGTLKNGDSSFSVNLGESVRVTLKSGGSYDVSVVSIGAGTSGGGNSWTSSHSISVLSISGQNSTALVTLEVDGKTYADKEAGVVVATSWGEIKIMSVDVSAQTVTVMHGDQTLTLHAGQVVVK